MDFCIAIIGGIDIIISEFANSLKKNSSVT